MRRARFICLRQYSEYLSETVIQTATRSIMASERRPCTEPNGSPQSTQESLALSKTRHVAPSQPSAGRVHTEGGNPRPP
jgi:hypothetical protein